MKTSGHFLRENYEVLRTVRSTYRRETAFLQFLRTIVRPEVVSGSACESSQCGGVFPMREPRAIHSAAENFLRMEDLRLLLAGWSRPVWACDLFSCSCVFLTRNARESTATAHCVLRRDSHWSSRLDLEGDT